MTVFITLAGLSFLCFCLASIPIDFEFRFDSCRHPRFQCRIGWLFSLVKVDLPSGKRPEAPGKKRVKRKEKWKRFGKVSFLKLLSKALFLRCLRLAKQVLRAFHFKQFRVDIKAGLGEPADTGMLYGLLSAGAAFIELSDARRVRWTPDFGNEPVLEGTSDGVIRFRPIVALPAFAGFFFSRPVLRALRQGIGIWKSVK